MAVFCLHTNLYSFKVRVLLENIFLVNFAKGLN